MNAGGQINKCKNMKFFFSIAFLFISSLSFGQEWQQVGDFNSGLICLFTDTIDNLLYIGGEFKFNGNDTVNGVCYWDNNFIHKMGAGLYDACGNYTCQSPNSFIRYKGDIYTGSKFDNIAGVPGSGIAHWNGTSWLPILPGLFNSTDDGGLMMGSCEHDGLLYVSGIFRMVGTDTANSVASWNGTTWQTYGLPDDTQGDLPFNYRVIFYKNELYVGGNCYNIIDGNTNSDIVRYDGIAWHQVGNGLFGGLSYVSDMVIYHDELYVSGTFSLVDGNTGNKIMRWDGEHWYDVGGGVCNSGYSVTDMIVYDDKLYVVGDFDCVGDGIPANNIAIWNGEYWCNFGNTPFDNKINSIAVFNNEFYVGGGFTKIGGQQIRYFAKYVGDHSTDTCSTAVSVAVEPMVDTYLKISPNPAKDQLTITGQDLTTWRIFNLAGQEVTWLVHPMEYSTGQMLDVQTLPAGMYYLQGLGKGGIETGRFVKM